MHIVVNFYFLHIVLIVVMKKVLDFVSQFIFTMRCLLINNMKIGSNWSAKCTKTDNNQRVSSVVACFIKSLPRTKKQMVSIN